MPIGILEKVTKEKLYGSNRNTRVKEKIDRMIYSMVGFDLENQGKKSRGASVLLLTSSWTNENREREKDSFSPSLSAFFQ